MRISMKIVTVLFVCLYGISLATAGSESPYVGSFSRLGFNARGMGMGNGLVAVTSGELSTYYNPALAPYLEKTTVAAGVGLLSFDRKLNFLSISHPLRPYAGFSLGMINAGVSNIDGRNNDGIHTEMLSTFENQFYAAFGLKPDEAFTLGISMKLYYSKIYEEVTSSTVGFDVGATIRVIPELTLGISAQDLGSKYKWATSKVLGINGRNPTDKFPAVVKIGAAYTWTEQNLLFACDYETIGSSMQILQGGIEYAIHENFTLRGGIDRWELNSDATGAKPSFGFTAYKSFASWTPAITYAYVIEPFSSSDIHIITLSTMF